MEANIKGDLLTVNSLLTNDLNITAVLGVRVPIYYYYLYNEFTKSQKQLFKQGVIGLIESIAHTKIKPIGQEKTIILNVNINQNHNEVKSINVLQAKNDLRNILEEIYRWLELMTTPTTTYSRMLTPKVREDARRYRNKLVHAFNILEKIN